MGKLWRLSFKMKIAYLILAHKNILQLEKLINTLDNDFSDFYIHIDKKTEVYSKIEKPNVIYLSDEERQDITWGSFEMVKATLNLINKCLKASVLYDYVILLSGQDFPVKSNTYIESFFEFGNKSNYIDFLKEDNPYIAQFDKRNNLIYPHWMFKRNLFVRCIKKLYIFFTGGPNYTFPMLKKNKPFDYKLYYGSQWWALSGKCLNWMMEFLDDHPQFISYFETSLIPDESFFQTLFMLSPYANTKNNKILFVRWEEKGNHPQIIDKKMAIELVDDTNNRFLFARKFDLSIHKEAIDYLIKMNVG